MRRLIPALSLTLLLAACGAQQPANTGTSADAARKAAEAAVAGAPLPQAALQPGQSVQGSIEADVGKGQQSRFRSNTWVRIDILMCSWIHTESRSSAPLQ